MQTDSVLDAQDREIMWRWGQPATREFFTENASNCFRIAGELSRLEQENQRLREYNALSRIAEVESENRQLRVESDAIKASMFSVLTALKLGDHVRPQSWSEVVSDEIVPAIERLQTRVDSLDCAHKLALGEVERLKENEDHLTRLAILGPALTAARAEIQRLRSEMEANPATEAVIAERTNLRAEVQRLKKDNHRLRLEAEGLEEVARRWQASWNVERNDLSAFRAEVQRLRENAEIDKAQRAEWQETIDKLEAENARISNHIRLALILSDPGKVDSVMERISTLEGRVQGITEIVKQELAVIVERLRELEERVNRPSLVQEFVNSCTAEVRRLRAEMEQPVPPARNPFEDLRPPRGL